MINQLQYDAIIIGGGFYGSMVALHLSKSIGIKNVAILEKESKIFSRASSNNQFRVHNGYHYPRSFNTANRSRINFKKFIKEWPIEVINRGETSLYAIPKILSKINANQFVKFCHSINAKIKPANKHDESFFNKNKFDGIFETEEYYFNPRPLKKKIEEDLNLNNIDTYTNNNVIEITKGVNSSLKLKSIQDGSMNAFNCDLVINCSYSGLNQIKGDLLGPSTSLKHEIVEIVFIEAPEDLMGYGITVMDGPFFSILPTNNKKVHSLTHVRYSPHSTWIDNIEINPYRTFSSFKKNTRFERMIRSSEKYIPILGNSKYIGSKFEIKTILEKNEIDDGRPIFFEKDQYLPNLYYVLGSKIDNIYDVLDKLEQDFK